ncbi:hypothetical protein CLAIMM_06773, partial [Cladophialophora immunda]
VPQTLGQISCLTTLRLSPNWVMEGSSREQPQSVSEDQAALDNNNQPPNVPNRTATLRRWNLFISLPTAWRSRPEQQVNNCPSRFGEVSRHCHDHRFRLRPPRNRQWCLLCWGIPF